MSWVCLDVLAEQIGGSMADQSFVRDYVVRNLRRSVQHHVSDPIHGEWSNYLPFTEACPHGFSVDRGLCCYRVCDNQANRIRELASMRR